LKGTEAKAQTAKPKAPKPKRRSRKLAIAKLRGFGEEARGLN